MELDPIAYIDIVQICAVILAPGKPLTCTAPRAPPLSCTERGGAGTDTAALFNKLLLPRTLALMPRDKKSSYRLQWPLCPWPGQCSELP